MSPMTGVNRDDKKRPAPLPRSTFFVLLNSAYIALIPIGRLTTVNIILKGVTA